MTQPVFLIINATANRQEPEAHDEYLKRSAPISAQYGAVKVANYCLTETLDNQAMPEHCLVVSFPTRQSIFDLFSDPEYLKLTKLRNLGFEAIRYFIGSETIG